LYNLDDPKIVCGQDLPDASSCSPEEKSLSLVLGTLHQNGLDYVSSFPDTFRIFIPPGTVYGYVNIYMPIDGQEGVVVRYKQPPVGEFCQYAGQPSHYGDVPWDVPNQVNLGTMEQRDVYLRNWGGLAAAVSPFSLQIPISSADSGWLYIRKLPFTSSTIHKISVSFRVDVSTFQNWYDRVVWDVAGDPWSAAHGEAVARVCSSLDLKACETDAACEAVGAHWYGGSCNADIACGSDDFATCDNQSRCNNSDFYWYDVMCNDEVACTETDLEACDSQTKCESSGFYWYDDICNLEVACSTADLHVCDSQKKCEDAGFYWNGYSCKTTSPCRSGVLSACSSPDDCQGGGGIWYNGECHQTVSGSSGYSSSGSSSTSSGSSSSSSSSSSTSPDIGSFSGLGSLFGLGQSCGQDNLGACAQAECVALGPDYWWYGLCRPVQQQESYDDGRIVNAPIRLGDGANDGRISAGDGLSFVLDVPEGVRTYALVVFPNDVGAFFIDNNTLLSQQLVAVSNGELFVTDNLCDLFDQYPDLTALEGSWWIAFLTTPAVTGEFHSLDELAAYINNGGVYHFGSYNVTVGCQD